MINKKQLGIVLLFSIVPLMLLPLLQITGNTVMLLSLEDWFLSTEVSNNTTTYNTVFIVTSFVDEGVGTSWCMYSWNYSTNNIIGGFTNMTFDDPYWVATDTIYLGGTHNYNITCMNETVQISVNPAFNVSNTTGLEVDYNNLSLTYMNWSIGVRYYNLTGENISGSCSFSYGNGTSYPMTANGDYYNLTDLILTSDMYNASVNCTAPGHGVENYNFTLEIDDYFEEYDLGINPRYSSVVWGDIDNDDDWDLLVTGYEGLGFVQKCLNNNGVLSCVDSSIPEVSYGSLSLGDIDNDGDLDLVVSGNNNLTNILRYYKNNGGVFNLEQSLTGIMYSSNQLFDF
ncbi:hypothetical protein H6503_00270 [Candidatus Woesearchaeota archaeon]|nr:hypothetical protein [Candidatus Woesearchaeota archaeon]